MFDILAGLLGLLGILVVPWVIMQFLYETYEDFFKKD